MQNKIKLKNLQFVCYLEECKLVSATPEERKDHCIRVHKFPHDFRFENVVSKKKSASNEHMDTSETEVQPPTAKTKAINFHFGRKTQKAFTSRCKKPNPIETMSDLKESLPDV